MIPDMEPDLAEILAPILKLSADEKAPTRPNPSKRAQFWNLGTDGAMYTHLDVCTHICYVCTHIWYIFPCTHICYVCTHVWYNLSMYTRLIHFVHVHTFATMCPCTHIWYNLSMYTRLLQCVHVHTFNTLCPCTHIWYALLLHLLTCVKMCPTITLKDIFKNLLNVILAPFVNNMP